MRTIISLLLLLLAVTSCNTNKKPQNEIETAHSNRSDFIIAFGSCNNQNLPNEFWPDIEKNNPDVWIWGGDIVYADTEDMKLLKRYYSMLRQDEAYADFIQKVDVLGTWDDHDYGQNDGGNSYTKKDESQQILLDFLGVDEKDGRRKRPGVYFSKNYEISSKIIKVILLDTRYFRTDLTPDNDSGKRYMPNQYGEGTLLGEAQWTWLRNELEHSSAHYHLIVSSIQFLSSEHGFETWGNMPHEVTKLEELLVSSKAKNTIILSGDRHLSEISKKEVDGLSYPLIDFTSSGLTHSYSNYTGEPNQFRIGNVVSEKSFGLLKFDFDSDTVILEIKGKNNVTYETQTQIYR